MSKKMLILFALICFIPVSAWGVTESPGRNKAQSGMEEPTAAVDQNSQGGEKKAAPEVAAAKNEEKKDDEQSTDSSKSMKKCSMIWSVLPAVMFIVFLLCVVAALKKRGWSLSEALSESDPIVDPKAGGVLLVNVKQPVMDDKGTPIKENGRILLTDVQRPVYARSSSRLIAFIGSFTIIVWIIGLSIPTLYHFLCKGSVPELSGVSGFLLAQAGIFAPYLANKIAGAIKP
jgi:hypothetical protein